VRLWSFLQSLSLLVCHVGFGFAAPFVLSLLAHLSSIKDLAINTLGSVEEGGGDGGRIVWKS